MHKNEIERIMERAEEALIHELCIVEELLGHRHPRDPRPKDKILFEFQFCNITILQPTSMKKLIGAFSGTLVFKNAEGQVQDISKVTGLSLSVNDATIGNVSLTLRSDQPTPTGDFTGNGIAAGDLILTATATNDAGKTVTGTTTISFHADTTVTEIDVNVN